jgi:hypothetical protein
VRTPTVTLPLHSVAHGRSGDKGNRLNVSVIAYRPEFWPLLITQVTAERVKELFAHRGAGGVVRYELPNLQALNFVVDEALEGGVNSSLAIDTHGKTLSYRVLGMPVEVPLDLAGRLTAGLAEGAPAEPGRKE